MSDPRSSVLAILLAFDAPEASTRCIESIQRQSAPPAEILVVDNNGAVAPDLTALQHTGPVPVRLLPLATNLGPAGGHAAGLSAFLESGVGYAWEMNDTVEADEHCLARLLDEMDRNHANSAHPPPDRWLLVP